MTQESCVVYRDLSKKRSPSVGKIIRDGRIIYQTARYVIVLDEDGNVIERNSRNSQLAVNIIAVLAPVEYKGNKIPLSVVLEIGISQTTPYERIEKCINDEKINVSYRRTIAKLTDNAVISLMPEIAYMIQRAVDENISHRKNHVFYTKITSQGKLAKSGKIRLAGTFITIPFEEYLLVYVCLAKDWETRKHGHLSDFVRITKNDLSKLKFGYYPAGQLKKYKVIKKIVYVLEKANYPQHFVDVIRNKLGKENSKYRALFEQIIYEFNIKFKGPSEIDIMFESLNNIWCEKKETLMETFPISVATHPKRIEWNISKAIDKGHVNLMHAKGCLRVEVFPSKAALDAKNPIGPDGVRVVNLSEKFMNGGSDGNNLVSLTE